VIIFTAAASKRKANSNRNVRGSRCGAPTHEPRSPPKPMEASQTANRPGNERGDRF
jgi:hypothetical protein